MNTTKGASDGVRPRHLGEEGNKSAILFVNSILLSLAEQPLSEKQRVAITPQDSIHIYSKNKQTVGRSVDRPTGITKHNTKQYIAKPYSTFSSSSPPSISHLFPQRAWQHALALSKDFLKKASRVAMPDAMNDKRAGHREELDFHRRRKSRRQHNAMFTSIYIYVCRERDWR